MKSLVLWDNVQSNLFPIQQGVRQGAVLSPLLYSLFINDLLYQLEEVEGALCIDGIFCGAPTYVDDVCLVSASPHHLQLMLDMAGKYANEWLYSFNTSKSVIIILGESANARMAARCSREFILDGSILSEVDSAKHLGVLLSVSSLHISRASSVITSFRSAFYALATLGTRFSCLNPSVSLFLLKSFCLPLLTFCFGIWTPPSSVVTMMD